MGRGENEGVHMLPEFVCKAIPDPSLDLDSEVWKKARAAHALKKRPEETEAAAATEKEQREAKDSPQTTPVEPE
jgi:hypothetical protein